MAERTTRKWRVFIENWLMVAERLSRELWRFFVLVTLIACLSADASRVYCARSLDRGVKRRAEPFTLIFSCQSARSRTT